MRQRPRSLQQMRFASKYRFSSPDDTRKRVWPSTHTHTHHTPHTRLHRERQSAFSDRASAGTADGTASVPPELARELMLEVGWESRRSYVDVRSAEVFARGRPRGAVSLPWNGGQSFVERAAALEQDPGRLLVGGAAAERDDVVEAARLLEQSGFSTIVTFCSPAPLGFFAFLADARNEQRVSTPCVL